MREFGSERDFVKGEERKRELEIEFRVWVRLLMRLKEKELRLTKQKKRIKRIIFFFVFLNNFN